MNACPYCNTEIVDGFYFCTDCEKQVKCRRCNSLLLANKSRCLVCGTLLASHEPSQQPMNTFSLEERQTSKSYERRVNIQATDNAVGQFMPMIGGVSSIGRTSSMPLKPAKLQLHELPPVQAELPLSNDITENAENEASANEAVAIQTTSQDGTDEVTRFFHRDGEDKLVSLVNNYKVKSLKEQQQRFMLMYVWAYPLYYGKPIPSKEHLFAANRQMLFADKNYARYFEEIRIYFAQKGTGFILNYEGEQVIRDIIRDLRDNTIRVSYTKAEKSTAKKRTRLSNDDEQIIDQWVAMPVDIGAIDVRKLESSTYQAIFALWVLTKKLGVAEAVKYRVSYEYLVRKFTTISADRKLFLDALNRKSNASLFDKNAHGLYYIKEKAEMLAAGWAKGAPVKGTKEAGTDTDEEKLNERPQE